LKALLTVPAIGQQLSLKGRALRALAARELTRAELINKLKPHLTPETESSVEPLLDELQEKGYLSDLRAAQSLVHRRAPKLGAMRVVQELKARGADAQAVQEATQALRGTELERARVVWAKKFDAPPSNAVERGKQMRFLVSRGFDGATIGKLLRNSPE
jgi:regulatory protein